MSGLRIATACLLAVIILPLSSFGAPFDQVEELSPIKPDQAPANQPPPSAADPVTSAPNVFADVLPEINEAQGLLLAGDLEGCQDKLRAACAKKPNLPPPKLILARLLLRSNQVQASRKQLEEVVRSHPGHPELYILFGTIALHEGRVTDAELHFDKAASLEPPQNWIDEQKQWLARECLAAKTLIAESREDWGEAVRLYQQRVNANANDAVLRDQWAMALFRNGQVDQAFDQFDIAYRREPRLNPPEISMAVMYVREQNFPKTEQWFKKALARYPENPAVYYERGIALLYEDRAEDAEKLAAKAEQLGLDSNGLLLLRGTAAMQLGHFDRAEEFFQQVLSRQPEHLAALTNLAMSLAEQNDAARRKRALDLLQAAAEKYPSSPLVQSALGRVQFRSGQLSDAEASLRAAAAQIPADPATLFTLCLVLIEQDRQEEALRVARQLDVVMDQPAIFAFRPTARRWLATVVPKR